MAILSFLNVWPVTIEKNIPAGTYVPFFSSALPKPIQVDSFTMDVYPVTQNDFLAFVQKNPEWRRSRVSRIFADESYLKDWKSDLQLRSSADKNRPITQISWFAATAYCREQGKELPTTDQWEYVAEDSQRESKKLRTQILDWYAIPNQGPISEIGQQPANGYGISDLFGLIWEWTQDFNSFTDVKEPGLFCGSAALNSLDVSDYAKFMRYSLRNSLQAKYTTSNLGFRCTYHRID